MSESTEALITTIAGCLTECDAVPNLAVRDISLARHFYEEVLGFEPVGRDGDGLVSYRSGSTVFNVYRSEHAGTNRATAMTWRVGKRIDDVVETLRGKGISFEHYDLPGLRREGDLYVAAGLKVAWFKDPDGNILNLVTG